MKKWLKRVLIGAAIALVVLVVLGIIAWRMTQGIPDWYRPDSLTVEQREAAAQSATNKLANLQNQTAYARAEQSAASYSRLPATAPAGITISFTDDELNALLSKWSVWQSVRNSYQRFLSDPYIVLMDGRLILAGRVTELDSVASIHFQPSIDPQGRLNAGVARVLAGKLPIPQGMIDNYQKQAADGLNRRLPLWRVRASIDSTGIANNDAVSAAMGELVMNILQEKPCEPVVFMEVVSKGRMPVRISSLKIENHTVTLTVHPMTSAEREQFLQKVKGN
jgi:uncharacterized protein YpmS